MSIIIGIDHGYYAIKTAHCSFPAGLTSYGEHEPYTRQGLLEFGGCFFVCGFGFRVVSIDGHDFAQIEDAFQYFHAQTGAPTAILMHTTKGKGVSYMENSVGWHGKAPNDEEYKIAMDELQAHMAELEAQE